MATTTLALSRLLPQSGNPRPSLDQGLGRPLGPVSRAIRACRETDPADQAIADIQIGLTSSFADADRQRVRELRRRIADRIEADLALLDALDGDTDREPDTDHEPDVDREPDEQDCCSAEWTGRGSHHFNRGVVA